MNALSQANKTKALAGLLSVLCLVGCASPAYYSQAISGHMKLMNQREDISAALASSSIDPETARKLSLSIEIRAFAVEQLSLPDNDSYSQFVQTGENAVSWNVVAAPEFSLKPRQWCFMVAGCVPYRGYFKAGAAAKFADKLSRDGFDTDVSPAIAYSTLGWFDDPLLDTMLQYNDEQLAALIFHELAHQQLYVKGDTAFNEAYASFVEETGVRLWLESRGQSDLLPQWQQRETASLQLNALLRATRKKLGGLYASNLPESRMRAEKAAIFDELREAYKRLVEEEWNGRSYFASFISDELNNANLALINSYQGGACAFAGLYADAGENLAHFQELAAIKASLKASQRANWLNQPCDVIASNDDL